MTEDQNEEKINRRSFLKLTAGTVGGLALGGAIGYYAGGATQPTPSPTPTLSLAY